MSWVIFDILSHATVAQAFLLQWLNIFVISSVIFEFSSVIFMIFSKGPDKTSRGVNGSQLKLLERT
jgi:hypothetical protein